MAVKIVVKKRKRVFICDVTGEVIAKTDIAARLKSNIISRKGWEKVPETLKHQPFLDMLLTSLSTGAEWGSNATSSILAGFSTGFWVISCRDYDIAWHGSDWTNIYNYRGHDKNDIYQTEQDVLKDLTKNKHRQVKFHLFKDGKYLYTVKPVVEIKLEKSNILEGVIQ